MDRASFELIGNVGKLEISPVRDERKLAIVSIATSERWKIDAGDWNEKTCWRRVVVPGSTNPLKTGPTSSWFTALRTSAG